MPRHDDHTFFLYSDGCSPQDLALGHLVFGSYATPNHGHYCRMPKPLGEDELESWADVQLRTDFCYSTSSLEEAGFSLSAIDLVNAGLSGNQEMKRSIATKKCRRITLKDPQKFLSGKVLAVDSTFETVQKWLSISTHEYVLKKLSRFKWWPKIWIVTGVYELEDCTSFSWNKSDMSAEAGVAAEIMTLLNIPLGGTGNIARSYSKSTQQTFPGRSVWAARYQLLDARYIHVTESERDNPTTSIHMPLQLKAIWSSGGFKEEQNDGESKEPENMALLSMGNEFSTELDGDSKSEHAFWVAFTEAKEDWEDGYSV
ncbi:hypothetical protein B0T25DRAFT_466645 [Lasiosphaeria hispida]|uniref:Uncharacterized protein n=1 Tax=Lasiosphaeria hispida TaxID=260671 RepID=A0AAJ0M7R3_9PEZI|nr:hypothetical protein B0T25DRAFT_466645 [Lasiosphaeria hispida]